jgi:hypothetical protein
MESEDNTMSFQAFCENITTIDRITDTSPMVPVILQEPFDALVSNLRTKMARLDRIEIVFIQMAFDDMEHVFDILDNYYHGEINDALTSALSDALYHAPITNLTSKELSVIKVLTVYLMIQSHLNEEL